MGIAIGGERREAARCKEEEQGGANAEVEKRCLDIPFSSPLLFFPPLPIARFLIVPRDA